MINFIPIMILLWSGVWLPNCIPLEKRGKTQKRHRTGEPIASDSLIKKYEGEHQKFYEQETKDGNYLGWPYLFNKNHSNFCKKYIQYVMPGRTNEGTMGLMIETTLHYEKENTSMKSSVVVIQCKVMGQSDRPCYYVTRAPESNCIYTLKHTKCRGNQAIFTIINKYCDFECQPLIAPKRKRTDMVEKVDRRTSQPIAKDDYLLQYELEHQELVLREGENNYHIMWPYVKDHHNLTLFCHQYLRKCVPKRKLRDITWNWKLQKLYYRKLKTNEYITMKTVRCVISNMSKLHYQITRAPENNCVYALLRLGKSIHFPLVIIFKHCDFENPNEQPSISEYYNIGDKNLIPKTEVKEEMLNILEAQ